jgi:hypothetical protein
MNNCYCIIYNRTLLELLVGEKDLIGHLRSVKHYFLMDQVRTGLFLFVANGQRPWVVLAHVLDTVNLLCYKEIKHLFLCSFTKLKLREWFGLMVVYGIKSLVP